MTTPLTNVTNSVINSSRMPSNTITALKRWSCQNKELPPASHIKALHVYDFDNTLFKSPLPNPKLWNPYTVSRLQNQDVFINGGWWHDHRMLEVTGQGIEEEEPRAWSGWWNEQIAELVRLSAEQDDALTVLLTGRAERNFSDLIQRIVRSKQLNFDLICLKPEVGPKCQRFASTIQYKQAFLQDLVYTYHEAKEIKVYEDRPKQTKAFRDFFQNLNQIAFPDTCRKPIKAEVIQVADQVTSLDPVVETAEVQRMINRHNAQLLSMVGHLEIKRTVFFTGYLVSPADTAKLLDLVKIPPNLAESEVRYLGSSIMIAPRPADQSILNRTGGFGTKQTWQVTGFSFYQSNIWAVRVAPVPPSSSIYTIHHTPLIVLATYKNTRPDLANNIKTWQPVPADKQYILEAKVGEKVQLRIDVASDDNEPKNYLDRRGIKRRHSPHQGMARTGPNGEDIRRQYHTVVNGRTGNNNRNKGMGPAVGNGRIGAQGSRVGRSHGAGLNSGRSHRQKGPKGNYRSLDEAVSSGPRYGLQRGEPNYDGYSMGGGFEHATSSKQLTNELPYGQ